MASKDLILGEKIGRVEKGSRVLIGEEYCDSRDVIRDVIKAAKYENFEKQHSVLIDDNGDDSYLLLAATTK